MTTSCTHDVLLQIRLVMLYALRFEQDSMRIRQLQEYLITAGVKDRSVQFMQATPCIFLSLSSYPPHV